MGGWTRGTRAIATGVTLVLASVGLVHAVSPDTREFARDHLVTWAGGALEQRFPVRQSADPRPVAGIIALGGLPSRTRAAVEIARAHPGARIILSGPGAEEVAIVQRDEGVARRMIADHRARNTYENARFSRDLAQPQPGERWILVTSGVHMPRAMGAFRAAEFAVEPFAVRDIPRQNDGRAVQVRRELLGLIYYRLLGRTDALFPGPSPEQLRQPAPSDMAGGAGPVI